MSDLPSLIKSFKSCGLSEAEAITEARAERAEERAERAEERAERARACELFNCYFIVFFFDYRNV